MVEILFLWYRGGERGQARPEILSSLLKTTERVVQEIDSVEYGLTDIQEYYANTGALKRAAETAQGELPLKVYPLVLFSRDIFAQECNIHGQKGCKKLTNFLSFWSFFFSLRMRPSFADVRSAWCWFKSCTSGLGPSWLFPSQQFSV